MTGWRYGEGGERWHGQHLGNVPYDESVISYLVQLKELFRYSYRDIERLSKGQPTRFPDKDKIGMVQWAAKQLKPMSYSTVRRIMEKYMATGDETKKVRPSGGARKVVEVVEAGTVYFEQPRDKEGGTES